ncbi:conserved protein of unknown function (plasmid) [Rhodovastum atsumiense]|uniref:Phage tail assembly protein n=1 Tax=Rhodovastum atsumiense TaxID=504468 RepID=A0A5M6IN18_9PROT|nr:hypothetical protein [Rhodovastum atsumiense]KAA5609653.1 hypothetical protein F1189_23100 [Rhodovastum atsumiense]CAH2606520.1 conserved protein of unknown function [Rhodovastum atsumiense]
MVETTTVDGKLVATDKNGRKYTLRPLGPENVFDILEAAGEQSTNRGLLAFMGPAFSVEAIDGVPVPMPKTLRDARALVVKLGAAGMEAVRAALEMDASAEVDEAAAKN